MISNVAEILQGFLTHERHKLDEFNLKHGPTIGKMYEGLTANVLDRAIPDNLGLQVVSGVIFDDTGTMTGEIDCMLVEGEGEEIPYTDSYKWHIKNVIAVLEVKKTLYSKDLADAFVHVRGVMDSYSRYIQGGLADEEFNVGPARKSFSQITKKIAPPYPEIETLPFSEELIFHTLVMEQISPVRIILGHHGFKKESTFREAMISFIEENQNQHGFGPGSFPQLIISEHFSLVKANGQPYSVPMRNEYWNFFLSSPENPVLFILELIWTRLQRDHELSGLWGEDLKQERMHPFLSGRAIKKGEQMGWEYQYTPIEEKVLVEEVEPEGWSPVFLDKPQFVIIYRLCSGEFEEIDNPDMIAYIESEGAEVQQFIDSLLSTGLIALNGKRLELITEMCQCVILPTGEFVAAENNTGRLSRWVAKRTGHQSDATNKARL